jgi:acetyl-CoA carboxylase carboxyltransferase component
MSGARRQKRRRSNSSPEEWEEGLGELQRRREWALAGSGPVRAEYEHRRGRLTARERIAALTDEGTFQEFGMLVTTPDREEDLPTAFICGLAEIDGRPVAVGAEDFTIQRGAAGVHLARFKGAWGGFLEELALGYRVPLVLLLHGAGGSVTIQERLGYPELVSQKPTFPIFELLDRVPVVTGVFGPAAGGSAARAAISHFSTMSTEHGCLFIGGPDVVKQATGQAVTKFELGGADVHVKVSGTVDNACASEDEIFAQIRRFLSYLPRNVWERPPWLPSEDPDDRSCDELLSIVSPLPRKAYDPRALIETVVDEGSFFELAPDFGRAVRVGLGRLGGHPIGILASDPRFQGGAMDGPAADKQARFVETFDCFHLPIVYFADVPGLLIGPAAEKSGLIRRGARAVQAIQRACVPVFTVQVRRSFGLGGQGTGNRKGHSIRLAWPSGVWGDMPIAGGVAAEYGAEIAAAEDPGAKQRELEERFAAQNSMWRTVERFGVEEVIDPRETRAALARLIKVAVGAIQPEPKTGPQVRP